MAELKKRWPYNPDILALMHIKGADITHLMTQDTVLEGLKTEQLQMISFAIDAQLAFRQMNGEVLPRHDEYAQEEAQDELLQRPPSRAGRVSPP
jgi:hypothetical protein